MNPKLQQSGSKGGKAKGPTKARPLSTDRARQMARERWSKHYQTGRGTLCSLDNDASIRVSTSKDDISSVTCPYCVNLLEMQGLIKMSPTDNQKPLPGPLGASINDSGKVGLVI